MLKGRENRRPDRDHDDQDPAAEANPAAARLLRGDLDFKFRRASAGWKPSDTIIALQLHCRRLQS
jgi:hypothetical protein